MSKYGVEKTYGKCPPKPGAIIDITPEDPKTYP